MNRLEPILGTQIIKDGEDEIRLGHTWHEVSVIMNLIKSEKPDWFIELGVHEGGLAHCLIPKFPDLRYVGVEINCHFIRPAVNSMLGQLGNLLLCGDCFSQKISSQLYDITKKGKIIFYCDGGNKVKEVQRFFAMMKPDDIIMAHDYWDEFRSPIGIDGYGLDLEFPIPEVLSKDVDFLREDSWFVELLGFEKTRIVAFRKK